MTVQETRHSKLVETLYPENFHSDIAQLNPDLINMVRLSSDNTAIELSWLVSVTQDNYENPIADYSFKSLIEFSDLTTYDNDLKTMIVIVYHSYTELSRLLTQQSGNTPLIDAKFEEIAIRALELLTDVGLY